LENQVDAHIPPIDMTKQMNQEQDTSSNLNQGPLTRSHAKKLQQQVTSFLAEFDNNISENIKLPKSSSLVLLGSIIKDMMTLMWWREPTSWRTYNEITLSSSGHKDQTTIRLVLSDIKKIPYLQIYKESRCQ
jgi:hypothetical protein